MGHIERNLDSFTTESYKRFRILCALKPVVKIQSQNAGTKCKLTTLTPHLSKPVELEMEQSSSEATLFDQCGGRWQSDASFRQCSHDKVVFCMEFQEGMALCSHGSKFAPKSWKFVWKGRVVTRRQFPSEKKPLPLLSVPTGRTTPWTVRISTSAGQR